MGISLSRAVSGESHIEHKPNIGVERLMPFELKARLD